MPFRISEDDKRAAKVLNSGNMDCARAYCKKVVSDIDKKGKHGRIDNILPLAEAAATYQDIAADAVSSDEGEKAQPHENFMNALFQGTRAEVKKKGCFRCEYEMRRHFFGAFWIRHDGDKHYIVFTDVCGNTSEEQIISCPWCKRDFEEDGDNVQTSDWS